MIDGDERGLGLARRDRVRIDVEGRGLAQVADDGVARHDVAAVDAERLAERADQHVDRAAAGDLLGAAAGAAEAADAVGVVDHQNDVLRKERVELGDELWIASSGA